MGWGILFPVYQGEICLEIITMLKKRILTNTFINFSGKLFSFLLQLFIITYLIKSLGKDTYGIFVLALAIVGNTNLLEAGFGLSVTKYVAEHSAKRDREGLLQIINTNFLVTTVIAVLFALILTIVNEFFLDVIFFIPDELKQDTLNLIRVLISLSLIEFWSTSIIRIAEGFQRYSFLRLIEICKWFLRTIFAVFAVVMGYGLVGIGIAYLAAGMVILAVLYTAMFRKSNGLEISSHYVNLKSFKLLFGFSIWVFLSKIFAFLSYRIDTILIGIFLPPVNLTYYSIAFKIYEIVRFGFSLLSSTIVPVTSELNALADKDRLILLFKKSTKYTLLIMYPFMTFMLFYSNAIIELWIGKGFDIASVLSQLFIISLFFSGIVVNGAEMMVGLNRLKKLVPYSGISAIINFIISLILIQVIGVKGVVIGTIVGTIFVMIGYLYYIVKQLNLSLINFGRDIIVRPLIITTVLSLLFLSVKNLYAAILVSLLSFSFIFMFMVDREDKDMILSMTFLKKG